MVYGVHEVFTCSVIVQCWQEVLLHDVVIPTLQSISRDPEPEVRKVAVETLVYIAEHCSPHWISSLVDIINQVGGWSVFRGRCTQWVTMVTTTQVANLCVANDDRTSPEGRMAGGTGGGLGGRQQDTKVALFGLVSLFKVSDGGIHGYLCLFAV